MRAATAPKRWRACKVHTKFVPDLELLPTLDKSHVRAIIDRSLQRLHMDRLDLVQFHWWDYAIPGCVEAALLARRTPARRQDRSARRHEFRHRPVAALRRRRRADGGHAGAVFAARLSAGAGLRRRLPPPRHASSSATAPLAGGFLGETWLGAPEPRGLLENRSLTKYKLIIDDFGGWPLFQALLEALRTIATRHGVDIATVASRYVLDRPQVAAVIVGARNRAHLAANTRIGALRLTDQDRVEIGAVLARRMGPAGDVFALERDRAGRHGSIMKYNLSAKAS